MGTTTFSRHIAIHIQRDTLKSHIKKKRKKKRDQPKKTEDSTEIVKHIRDTKVLYIIGSLFVSVIRTKVSLQNTGEDQKLDSFSNQRPEHQRNDGIINELNQP